MKYGDTSFILKVVPGGIEHSIIRIFGGLNYKAAKNLEQR
jgi:hypothetical protein